MRPELEARHKAGHSLAWREELRSSGPVRERSCLQRIAMPERSEEERVRCFREVNLGLSAEQAVAEARRCLDCAKPSCVEGCPVSIDIPSFVKLIEAGRFADAAKKIRESNSLPSVSGRVCPQEAQCEKTCNLARSKNGPVAIGNLERFAADEERRAHTFCVPCQAKSTGKKVAIVGAGPSGLTAAGELASLGHKVTVFEALHEAGGVLIYGIPEFRLPKEILSAEIANLKCMGVEFRMNFIVGRTASIEDLRAQGYDAFFVGSGAGLPHFMNVPGENLAGVYSANEYLTRVNLLRAYEFPAADTPVHEAKNAAVIGGGNVALDSVRTALRLGASKAMIIYRRSRAEMPARNEEVRHAEAEGVDFRFLVTPIRYLGDKNGRVRAVECRRMELGEPDASGRRKPVPMPGSDFTLETDMVVVAVGQSPNPLIPQTTPGIKLGKWGNIEIDEGTMETSIPGVFAGGDIVRGGATVILAMGDARRAAAAIDARLRGKS